MQSLETCTLDRINTIQCINTYMHAYLNMHKELMNIFISTNGSPLIFKVLMEPVSKCK